MKKTINFTEFQHLLFEEISKNTVQSHSPALISVYTSSRCFTYSSTAFSLFSQHIAQLMQLFLECEISLNYFGFSILKLVSSLCLYVFYFSNSLAISDSYRRYSSIIIHTYKFCTSKSIMTYINVISVLNWPIFAQ